MSSFGTTPSGAAERGFVLATTLLATTLLTVMLAASFLLVSAEQRVTDNSFSTARALALAQAGLQSYFSQNRGLSDTSTYDSMHVTLVMGYADVVATKVRRGGASSGSPLALWVVRSTGAVTSPVMAGQVQGTRTIAQFAQLNLGLFPARAALVTLNGVVITGDSGLAHPVTGGDLGSVAPCTSPGSPTADTFAISYANGAPYTYAPLNPRPRPTGVPTGLEPAYPSWSNLYDTTHVDWPALMSGNFIPDYTVPPASYPAYSNNYLVGYVPGNATLPTGQRRGVLVITGDVTVQNNTHWDGIILAGGKLVVSPPGASFMIHGMIITGLNRSLGQIVPPDTLARGAGQHVQWAWCYTQSSINALSTLVPLNNGWADTWSTY